MRRFLILVLLSLWLVLSPVVANALSADSVSRMAKEFTVMIDGCTSGSGVLFQREGDTYSVLTAHHVVDSKSGCLVKTPDSVRHPMNPSVTVPQSRVDVAIVQFTSDRSYKLAQFGNSEAITEGKTVYVSGAPQPSQAIPNRTMLVTEGKVVGRQRSQKGYGLIYDNITRRGMSGGAVLNEDGQVIGIHGQGDEEDGSKSGLNLGIPIELLPNIAVHNPVVIEEIQQSIPWTTVFYSIGGLGLLVGVGFGVKQLLASGVLAWKGNKIIPWDGLGAVILLYTVMGFAFAPWLWAWVGAWAWAGGLAVAGAGAGALALVGFLAMLGAGAVLGAGALAAGAVAVAGAVAGAGALALILAGSWTGDNLQQSFSKFHTFLILATTSSLGLGVGWLLYQLFPVLEWLPPQG